MNAESVENRTDFHSLPGTVKKRQEYVVKYRFVTRGGC